ncbi:MAG: glycosyltransferase family 2 protein [Cyanobacteria bacterium]|nr:glycosyltransferase family 2 protein [Cyanobacteriota bacterium]
MKSPENSPATSLPRKGQGQVERTLLWFLLLSVWGMMLVMDRFLPWVSSVIIIMAIMTGFGWLISLAMIDQKRRLWKKPQAINTDYLPSVSILVPAHNEENVIANTVRLLMTLDYPDYEVLVMDDRSTDKTPEILAQLKSQLSEKFRYFIRPEDAFPGKSAVLNDALAMTTSEILCVFDADASVDPDFLRKMIPFLEDEEVGGAQARKIIRNASENWLTVCQNYEYSLDAYFQAGRDTIRTAVELRGNGELIKRVALESVGGWNNHTITDDLDLSTQLHLAGWDIRFAHKVFVWEEGITHFLPLLRQRKRWAEGSLRRYLEHAGSLLTSNLASMRTKSDMIAYVGEFLIPIWVVSDYFILLVTYLMGEAPNPDHLLSSFIILPWLTIFFTSHLIISIIRFNRPGFNKPDLSQAFIGAILTGLYMVWVWAPIVFWVTIKILFQKERTLDWGKTEHLGSALTPEGA